MITISDTTPIHYLIILEITEILPKIFGEIIIPEAVAEEMMHPKAPLEIRNWIASPPTWVRIRSPRNIYQPKLRGLGKGEIAAIALAIEEQADAVLMDDREAIREGKSLNLNVFTTLSVLEIAAIRNLLNFEETLEKLSETSFRMPPDVIKNEYLQRDSHRRSKK
jgi:predicted nucleic acid-binding protein